MITKPHGASTIATALPSRRTPLVGWGVVVGAMHRGVEKLFEVRDYTQILMLADRHDWQAPFAAELTVALTCEQMLGLEPPVRAGWLRTLLAEHTRLLSHLGFLGWLPHRLGTDAGVPALREALRGQTLALTGNRVHPMLNRVGGLAADALRRVRPCTPRSGSWSAHRAPGCCPPRPPTRRPRARCCSTSVPSTPAAPGWSS